MIAFLVEFQAIKYNLNIIIAFQEVRKCGGEQLAGTGVKAKLN